MPSLYGGGGLAVYDIKFIFPIIKGQEIRPDGLSPCISLCPLHGYRFDVKDRDHCAITEDVRLDTTATKALWKVKNLDWSIYILYI